MGHKLPGVPRRDFERALKAKGYHVDRRTGGHDIWEKTTTLSCVIPSHSREIEGGLAKRLAKEHGLNI